MRYVSLVFATVFAIAALLSGRLLRRYEVSGESMLPTYKPGDLLLAESLSYLYRTPRLGEVVIVHQPGAGNRKDLKRIAAGPGATVMIGGEPRPLGPDEWFVRGDNPDASTDSRSLGPIHRRDIFGRVWFQYSKLKT